MKAHLFAFQNYDAVTDIPISNDGSIVKHRLLVIVDSL